MRPVWHPLSTVLLADPPCFATDGVVRMLLATEGRVELVYAGDRMWPALEHGCRFTVRANDDTPLERGEIVLVSRSGIPDALRVEHVDGESIRLVADADPDAAATVLPDVILGRTDLTRDLPYERRIVLRRVSRDLKEAWTHRPDRNPDPAATVRDKYESQAAYYARSDGAEIDPALLALLRERIPFGRRVLVVGSGAGRESFALANSGWHVVGVEFSPSMVELSIQEAARRTLDVEFLKADIRDLDMRPRSLGGVLFTYDVYSFLPRRRERIALLRRLQSWLAPGGVVFLSARRLHGPYERMILSLQWLALQRSGEAEWGDSHTRWIPNDGAVHRSFVHVFSDKQLREETAAAGFVMGSWRGGHCVLKPVPAAIIPS